jgi:hypothetical protein
MSVILVLLHLISQRIEIRSPISLTAPRHHLIVYIFYPVGKKYKPFRDAVRCDDTIMLLL